MIDLATDSAVSAALAFGLLFAIFFPLEDLFGVRRQGLRRPGMRSDLLFFFGQQFLWTAPVVAALVWVHQNVSLLPLGSVRAEVAALPFWAQFLLVIALCDVSIYWAHRMSHQVPFLWRFHKVHHTAERLDWVAAYREHPLDNLYTRLVENLPAIVLGFPLPALAGFAVFRGIWAVYIHSNVDLTPGPLRYVLGCSRLHHWHHEKHTGGRCNFANLSPLTDLLFGTYRDPGHFPEEYGTSEGPPRSYVRQLVDPFRP